MEATDAAEYEPGTAQDAPGESQRRRGPHARGRRCAALRIGDFKLVTFPGELTVEIGLNIKKSRRRPARLRGRLHERLHLLHADRPSNGPIRVTPRRTAIAWSPPSGRRSLKPTRWRCCEDCSRIIQAQLSSSRRSAPLAMLCPGDHRQLTAVMAADDARSLGHPAAVESCATRFRGSTRSFPLRTPRQDEACALRSDRRRIGEVTSRLDAICTLVALRLVNGYGKTPGTSRGSREIEPRVTDAAVGAVPQGQPGSVPVGAGSVAGARTGNIVCIPPS